MAPPMLGMGKLRMLKGDDILAHRRVTDDGAGGGAGDAGATVENKQGLVFELLPPEERRLQAVQQLEPAFNVLYVETPRVDILQSPQWRAFTDTWREAMGMLAGAARLGLPHTSVADKSPYLDEALWSKPAGSILLNDRMQRAAAARSGTAFGTAEEQKQVASRRRKDSFEEEGGGWASKVWWRGGKKGGKESSEAAPLAALERAHDWQEKKLPPQPHFYLHEPSPSVVVGLNLLAYFLITKGNLKKAG
jgi:hypothetical protein